MTHAMITIVAPIKRTAVDSVRDQIATLGNPAMLGACADTIVAILRPTGTVIWIRRP